MLENTKIGTLDFLDVEGKLLRLGFLHDLTDVDFLRSEFEEVFQPKELAILRPDAPVLLDSCN